MRTAIALALLCLAYSPLALADETPPPAKGWFGSFRAPMIVCDASDQIVAIVNGAKAKPDGGARDKYDELKATLNKDGDPTCLIVQVMNIAVGEAIDLGRFQLVAGRWAHGWAVHIGTASGEWWMLYLAPSATPPASLDQPMILPHGLRLL